MRTNPVQKLHNEHVNMRRVIGIISNQIALIERQGEPDFVLLANALYYMRKFPSSVHHPKEDLVFSALLAAGAPLRAEVETLRQQHQEIYALEDQLMEIVLKAQAGNAQARMRLVELGKRYLHIQALHVQTEEQVLFPQALRLLKQKDWVALRAASDRIEDPLSGSKVAERYRYLYEYLLREAAVEGSPLPGSHQTPSSSSATISPSRYSR
ncbi:MAG: hemerythrin domain-containing protein [Gammaproteobacteria bacterium]|nr:hemerythrin domain-containing protein [Gammaproteobacteria bacterium]